MNFNPSLENNEGQRYFQEVYIPNKPEEVKPPGSSQKRKGFLDFIIKERGFSNMIEKGEQVTCLRTGYNPTKQRQEQEAMEREIKAKEHLQMVKGVFCSALMHNFLEHF